MFLMRQGLDSTAGLWALHGEKAVLTCMPAQSLPPSLLSAISTHICYGMGQHNSSICATCAGLSLKGCAIIPFEASVRDNEGKGQVLTALRSCSRLPSSRSSSLAQADGLHISQSLSSGVLYKRCTTMVRRIA